MDEELNEDLQSVVDGFSEFRTKHSEMDATIKKQVEIINIQNHELDKRNERLEKLMKLFEDYKTKYRAKVQLLQDQNANLSNQVQRLEEELELTKAEKDFIVDDDKSSLENLTKGYKIEIKKYNTIIDDLNTKVNQLTEQLETRSQFLHPAFSDATSASKQSAKKKKTSDTSNFRWPKLSVEMLKVNPPDKSHGNFAAKRKKRKLFSHDENEIQEV